MKSHFGQSYLHGNRVFSSKLGFFRNPERPTLFKRILSLYSANRVRSMIGTWFSSPTVWENQRLPPNAVRSGLPNPQHLGTISCFLKQVLKINSFLPHLVHKRRIRRLMFLSAFVCGALVQSPSIQYTERCRSCICIELLRLRLLV